MANCMVFHTQIASIMEVLANTAVADICKLVDDDYAVFRLEMTQSQKENRALRRKLQLLELKVARDRVLASRPSSVKILDRNRGMARGHLTGGHRSFVKPAGHNTWRDDQPITVDEGSGTSTHHVIVIESVDAEDAGPGVKLERSEGEDPGQSTDIQTGAAGVLPVATEDPTPTPPRTRRSITEVSGTPNAVLKSETDTETLTVAHRLLHTRSGHRSDPERLGPLGCPPAPSTEYLPVFHQSQKTVNSCGNTDGDALDSGGDDLSCFYTTEMDSGNISLGLETQTDLSRGDWNQYSSSVYSEGCLDKKGEVLAVDDVTVKVEGDTPLTWNADETHLGEGHSQDFLHYRESLETNPNVSSHSPVRTLRDRAPVSTSKGPSDSHCRVLFDQVSNSNDRARAQGGGNTSGSSKVKRFLCMFCSKGFSCLQKVEIHQRVHTGVKPFSCTQCDMRFAEAGSLKRHQRVHTGEKPYSCPQCHMRFTQAGSLKRHLKVHMGERLFV
ncbi:zinc finger protein with KRAB and SCAN domains 1-like [Oncorhynchus nerka]|uniref:zinc finger protein with KRAB and SCAN domains 1-like n=1 Tax=Oncorhynchus nerka TaxID=8023 RepID=UPI0031B83C1C